jgi:hypothetical protein
LAPWLEHEVGRVYAEIREAVLTDPTKPVTNDEFEAEAARVATFTTRPRGHCSPLHRAVRLSVMLTWPTPDTPSPAFDALITLARAIAATRTLTATAHTKSRSRGASHATPELRMRALPVRLACIRIATSRLPVRS